MLGEVRESYKTDKPIAWNRVHNLPHYAYFNHSIHLAKGVGCVSCHGQVNEHNLTMQSSTLLMEWCIACHRAPEKHLRPQAEVFNMKWEASTYGTNPDTGKPYTQRELGLKLKKDYHVRDDVTLTNCSICHR